MLLHQIAPYVRFANEVSVPHRRVDALCVDCRLLMITGGNGKVYIGGKAYELQAGTLLFWQAGTVYRFAFKNHLKAIVIDFDLVADGHNRAGSIPLILKSRLESERPDYTAYEFADAAVLNAPLVLENAFYMEERMRRVVQEVKKQSPFGNANASAELQLCISKIAETAMRGQSADIIQKIDELIDYIHKNYRTALTNERLAERIGYHPYYLNRVFKRVKGCTLHQYILNCRLSAAADRLLSTSLTVAEIAEQSGFNHPISLISAFKNRYHLTPTEFRNKTL